MQPESKILEDLEKDYVVCRICGFFYKSLKPHVARRHNMALMDYSFKFPGTPVIGKSTSKEISQAISKSLKGKPKSKEHIENLSRGALAAYKRDPVLRYRTGKIISKVKAGRLLSEEHKASISEGIKRAHLLDPTYGKRSGEGQRLLWANPLLRKKRIEAISSSMKENWRDQNFVKRMLEARHKKPNITESTLLELLDKEFPGIWGYNGDGSQSDILKSWDYKGGLIPDFVRLDGMKQVIFSNGYYWHPLEDEEEQVRDCNKSYIKCFVIWADNWSQVFSEWLRLKKEILEENGK